MEYTLKTKTGLINIAALLTVFAGILIFFLGAHPIVPWDGDDWGTLNNYNRHALPTWGTWNPSRVLPEVIGPLLGYLSAYVVYPIYGDYVQSITISVALLLATSMSIFFYMLCKLFYTLAKQQMVAICASFLVITLYFLIFKSKPDDNLYMLWSFNLCSAIYYLIPNLFNSVLVCYFIIKIIENKNLQLTDNNLYKYGFFILILYFAGFSMMWASAMVALYLFLEIVFGFASNGIKVYWTNKLQYNKVYLFFIVVFITYCVFEFFGGRSAELQKEHPSGSWLKSSFNHFMRLAKQVELLSATFGITALLSALFVKFRTKESNVTFRLAVRFIICAICISLFYIIADTKAGPSFASRIESVYGSYFFIILAAVTCCVYVVTKYPKSFLVMPVILVVLFNEATRSYKPFSLGHWTDTSSMQKRTYMTQWINEVKKADKEGKLTVTIKYPGGLRIWTKWLSEALYAHNITSRQMEIIFTEESRQQ